jgi:DNA polymerase-1
MNQTLYLIDGSGFIFRAYHALPPLSRPDGTPVGAVYGFCNMLSRLMAQHNGHKLLVVFDAGRQTFRQGLYPEYKAHRPQVPEDLIPQFPLFRESCTAFGVPCVEQAGFEADDLIASYTTSALQAGYNVVIVSSDKDLMQLIQPGVTMLDPIKNKTIGPDDVIEKFGVPPAQVVDVQALAGDSSDNVPGVPGIGIKTAAELIRQYGSVESLLESAHLIKQPKRREALLANRDLARVSKQLVTLVADVPLPMSLDSLVMHMDATQRRAFLQQQGFKTLLSRLENAQAGPLPTAEALPQPVHTKPTFVTLTTLKALDDFITQIHHARVCAIDVETTGLNIHEARLVGVSLAVEVDGVMQAAYVPLTHQTLEPQAPKAEALHKIKALCADASILKIGHNIKFDKGILHGEGISITPFEDTMVMSYCLDAGRHGHGLEELARQHLQYAALKFTDVVGTLKTPKTFDYVPLDKATDYAAEDAWLTLQLYALFTKRLAAENLTNLYANLEKPMVDVLAAMEWRGVQVDVPYLRELSRLFTAQMEEREHTIYKLAGHTFNIGSPKQLGDVLFEKNNLPAPQKSKTGAYVTDADVLERLAAQGYELPTHVLAWRSLSKLRSTYSEALQNARSLKTGRVHTSYNLAGTATGRLSSSDPNLQNIPIRTADGRKIRRAFIAQEGFSLVSFDYSQIELRLLAHMADVETLKNAFCHGEDIHSATAAAIHDIPLGAVTPEQRRRAKAINFGIIYGMSPFGLSQQLGCSTSEAAAIIKAYFLKYPGIQTYMERMKDFARHHGYVTTLMGRRCHVEGIHAKNPALRQYAERQAINAPLQGSNADIIKKAMITIHEAFKGDDDVRMLLQVHDELVFEIATPRLEQAIPYLKNIMESAVQLSVPIVVGCGIGPNWDAAH